MIESFIELRSESSSISCSSSSRSARFPELLAAGIVEVEADNCLLRARVARGAVLVLVSTLDGEKSDCDCPDSELLVEELVEELVETSCSCSCSTVSALMGSGPIAGDSSYSESEDSITARLALNLLLFARGEDGGSSLSDRSELEDEEFCCRGMSVLARYCDSYITSEDSEPWRLSSFVAVVPCSIMTDITEDSSMNEGSSVAALS